MVQGTGSCKLSCYSCPDLLGLHRHHPLVPVIDYSLVVSIGIVLWFCQHGSTSFLLLQAAACSSGVLVAIVIVSAWHSVPVLAHLSMVLDVSF